MDALFRNVGLPILGNGAMLPAGTSRTTPNHPISPHPMREWQGYATAGKRQRTKIFVRLPVTVWGGRASTHPYVSQVLKSIARESHHGDRITTKIDCPCGGLVMSKPGIVIEIPGFGSPIIRVVVSDYTGTLAFGGKLVSGVKEQL